VIRDLAQIGAAAIDLLVLIWLAIGVLQAFIWVAAAIGAWLADWNQRRIDDHYGADDRPPQDPPNWFDRP
jgi:hypothetical protein